MKRLALILVLALAGCTAAPAPTPAPTVTALEQDVVPVVPATLDAATAQVETLRLADAVQKLIRAEDLVHVDDHSQLVEATDDAAAYFGVIRTITLSPATDPLLLSQSMASVLTQSGWTQDESTDDTGLTLLALDSNGWFLLLGGDATVENQSVLTLQLASPDLP